MGKGVNIPLAADASSVISEGKKVEGALDRVVDSLDEIGRESKTTERTTEDALDGVADDATDAAKTLERKFSDAFDKVRKDSKTAGDDVGDNTKKGYKEASRAAKDFEGDAEHASDRASETTDEFKDEARANFSEVASSFSGDMASATDLVQGTLGGLAGSIAGPVGLAFGGLALTAGAFAQAWQANAEKTKQTISDMYDDMLASGADYLSKEYIADQLGQIYQGADDAAIKVKELRDLATTSNLPEPLLARALVGDEAARQELAAAIAAQRLKINEALDDATAKGQNMAPALDPAMQALREIEGLVNGTSDSLTEAQRNAQAARDAINGIVAPTQGVAQSADDARAKFDGIGRAIADLPKEIPMSIDTADLDRQVRAYRPPRIIVTGEFEVRAGQRVV